MQTSNPFFSKSYALTFTHPTLSILRSGSLVFEVAFFSLLITSFEFTAPHTSRLFLFRIFFASESAPLSPSSLRLFELNILIQPDSPYLLQPKHETILSLDPDLKKMTGSRNLQSSHRILPCLKSI